MFLIEVIPFARLPRVLPDTFSYFSAISLTRGAVVEIEVRQRKLLGIVLSAESVKDAKQELRTASFMLKKIGRIVSEKPLLNERDWELLRWFSGHYLTTPATVLRLLMPTFAFSHQNILNWPIRKEIEKKDSSQLELLIGEGAAALYQNQIEKTFARGDQALIITPDLAKAEIIRESISHKIPEHALFSVESRAPVAELRHAWHFARNGDPAVIIGARLPLFFPYQKLGLIIFDDDSSPAHKSWDQHPRYHARDVAAKLHELHGGTFIIVGAPPSIDAYATAKNDARATVVILPAARPPPVSLFVEMENEIREAGEFVALSQVLKDKLRAVLLDAGRAFLFVNRRGFAPFVLCQNCGESFRCHSCSVPLVYHAQESLREPTLLCHHCGAKNPAPDTCDKCGSHRLKPYGIGIERIARDIKKLFPGIATILISADNVKKPADAKKIAHRLTQSAPYIVIGTERALAGVNLPPVELTAIISVDTTLSLPDYAQDERLYRILSLTRGLATKHFIFQSYAKEPDILRDLFHGTFEHFAEKELKERRKFGYPPFSELLKLTVRGHVRERILQDVKELYKSLVFACTRLPAGAAEVTNPYPAYVEKEKGSFIFHILIKILDRPHAKELKVILNQYIGPAVEIDVGPLTLL